MVFCPVTPRIIYKSQLRIEFNAQMNRRERRAAAKQGKRDLNVGANGTFAATYGEVLRELQAGKLLEAQSRCRQELEANPEDPELLHLMALIYLNAAEYDHVVEWASRAIRKQPKPSYLATLGTALRRAGHLEEASKVFDKAIQLNPDDATLWANLGGVLEELTRQSDAVLCFQQALKLDPYQLEAACGSAACLYNLGRFEEALVQCDLCDRLRPHNAATLSLRSVVLRGLKRYEDYLADARRAHTLDPGNAGLCGNVGDALLLLDRAEEALEWFDRAFELQPSFKLALDNKSKVLRRLHRFDELMATYHQLRSIDPSDARVELNLAHDQLWLGNFEAGWRGREVRWRVSDLPIAFPDSPGAVWLGEDNIADKTILIYSDEGLGDAIQFTRYVPMLAARGARVVLVVQDSLQPLLSTLPGLSHCFARSETLPAADFRCPVMSLPLAFSTTLDTIPPPVRLSPPDDRVTAWQERLGPRDRLRVGLVWSGSLTHPNDRERSIALRSLTTLLDADATFVSLQKDPRPDDATLLLERTEIIDLTSHLTDFTETAALVSCLDLVITVDTSIAHLAATMGCPTWIMLAHTPDYRWLLNRDDSPWYPAVRLFRQTESRDYAGVIERVCAELSVVAANRRIGA